MGAVRLRLSVSPVRAASWSTTFTLDRESFGWRGRRRFPIVSPEMIDHFRLGCSRMSWSTTAMSSRVASMFMSEEGVDDLREAVRRGATERLAPIFMTAMAAGLALVPVALGLGKAGSQIQAPMAIVILFGLFSSTALNMIVVPAVYVKFGKRQATE